MSYPKEFQEHLQERIKCIKEEGRYKDERIILSPQGARIKVKSGEVLCLCANNYLGLANNPQIIEAAKEALDEWAYGVSSVRFICGTQQPYKVLEKKLSQFLGTEDTILYSSCAAANMGLFEPLFNFADVIISDALNHATIIDGIRLWKAIYKKKVDREEIKHELAAFIRTTMREEYDSLLEELKPAEFFPWIIPRDDLIEIVNKKYTDFMEKFLKEKLGKAVIPPETRVFKHSDMKDLERCLKETQDKRVRLICTDGVFSMDGYFAKLDEICDLAEKYNALVMVDDSHATGFTGKEGRGTHEYRGVIGRVDIITSTMGKALGGAAGGFTSGRKEIIELLRQRSREYLFSNSLPPVIIGATLAIMGMLEKTTHLRDKLEKNTKHFREGMTKLGFDIRPGTHPIVPIMTYEAKPAKELANKLLEEGIYVIAFSYPVVPKKQARIRVQISAAHSQEDIDFAIEKFGKVGRELGIIK